MAEVAARHGVSRSAAFEAAKAAPAAPVAAPLPADRRRLLVAAFSATLELHPALVELLPLDPEGLALLLEEEPTEDQIEAVDTRVEAQRLLRDISRRMAAAPEARYAALAEKALSAVNRIEQINARRKPPPAPDEVLEQQRAAQAQCTEWLLRHTRETAADFEKGRAGLLDGLDVGPATRAELERRVGALLGEQASA